VSTVPAPTLPPCTRAGIQLTPWPLSSSLELGALPTAVPCARLHAKQLAWEWGLSSIAETIELLVSELTTNAVHAVAGQGGHPAIRLRLLSDSTRTRIEVWDANLQPPAPQDPSADGMPDLEAESGRGLFLVTVLSDRWDWASTQEPQGKTVWCELDTARLQPSPEIDEPSVQPRLPQRIPSPVQVRPAAVINDPDILRRLRDGLRNLDRL
jgi:anti-sigma regulatory factor (Ser/Thr protein kinase)